MISRRQWLRTLAVGANVAFREGRCTQNLVAAVVRRTTTGVLGLQRSGFGGVYSATDDTWMDTKSVRRGLTKIIPMELVQEEILRYEAIEKLHMIGKFQLESFPTEALLAMLEIYKTNKVD